MFFYSSFSAVSTITPKPYIIHETKADIRGPMIRISIHNIYRAAWSDVHKIIRLSITEMISPIMKKICAQVLIFSPTCVNIVTPCVLLDVWALYSL